ncbi:15745_t:CDS:2, partial [Racocetra persica]
MSTQNVETHDAIKQSKCSPKETALSLSLNEEMPIDEDNSDI